MKLTFFLMLISLTTVFANDSYSQNTRLTLSVKRISLESFLAKIEEQSEFRFFYTGNIDVERKVTGNFRNEKITKILDKVSKAAGIRYEVMGRQIVLSPTAAERDYVVSAAQQKAVSGKITDERGLPLPGVTVVVKGTTQGTVTNADGDYTIPSIPENATLQFSFVGMKTQEIAVGNQSSINVSMVENAIGIEEVVAIGYGTQKKKDFTGAVSHVTSEQIANEAPSNIQDILIGNIPGLNVGFNASAKGGGDLLIRGKSSLTAGTSPLLVVDGVIFNGELVDINPVDIVSVDVLKDASSAAVYGAKAANGVVLITTKKGSSTKPIISFDAKVGLATLGVNEKPRNPKEFITARQNIAENIYVNHKPYEFSDPRNLPANINVDDWLAYTGATGDPVEVWLQRLNFQNIQIKNYKAGKTVDWYEEVYQTGLRQDYTVSLSGKKEEVSYYMSLEYLNNEGIVTGDKFETVRGRINLEGKAAKFMTAGINLQFADRDESQVPASWDRVVTNSPYGSMYNDDGTLRYSPDSDEGVLLTTKARNPFLENEYTRRLQKIKTLFSVIYLKGDLPFGFSYQINFNPDYKNYIYFNHNSSDSPDYTQIGGTATRQNREIFNWQIDNIVKWNRTFNYIHRFDVTLLANAEKYQSWDNQMMNESFQPNDDLSYHSIGSGTNASLSSSDQYSTGDALMARMNYTLKDRYLLTLSLRRDGYSAFGQKNPRATFPGVALGWTFSDEEFLRSKEWLNYAKLRFSYGINGNRDIGRYQAISDLNSGKYLYSTANGSAYQVSELYVNRMSNPNLKWERTVANNIGLDFIVLKNRLGGSIDLYKNSTTDLLVLRSLPNITGFENVMDNLGEVQNKGIELNLNGKIIDHPNFKWNSTFNFTLNRNKIIHLYGAVDILDKNGNIIGQKEPDDKENGWFIGRDIDVVWDYKVLGTWQVGEENEANKYGVRPGDFKLEDVDGDFIYTDDDKQFLGHRTPRFHGSLRNEFSLYKNFDLSFMLYSNWGQLKTFNWAKNATDDNIFPERSNNYKFPYWTPENPINDFAKNNSSQSVSYNVYRKASFIRLHNVSLAYNFSKNLAQKVYLENLKIYFTVTNVAFFAPDWNFWDPENSGPTPRHFTLGLNLTI